MKTTVNHEKLEKLFREKNKESLPSQLNMAFSEALQACVYPRSVHQNDGIYYYLGTSDQYRKYLWIYFEGDVKRGLERFDGTMIELENGERRSRILKCPLNHQNAASLQKLFSFTKPCIFGVCNTIGLGDRAGFAGPGQIRAIRNTKMRPVLAQQSVRELTRTGRTPEDVIDSAVWAVFQEGYHDGFAADADHLKTTEDIDFMAPSGFSIYTIDPSQCIDHQAPLYNPSQIKEKSEHMAWSDLHDTLKDCLDRYRTKRYRLSKEFTIVPKERDIFLAIVKYGNAILHTCSMYRYLKNIMAKTPFDLEISIDETDSVTTPFEHLFFAEELKRMGIEFVSLAPRFVGVFEKGVDYKGDLDRFLKEYKEHRLIAQNLGPYKISIHSASEKYSIFKVIDKVQGGFIHIKTTGTTYLVALKTLCKLNPGLFREIYNFSKDHFMSDKAAYHVSAKLEDVPEIAELADSELDTLFENEAAMQIMYCSYGSVLSTKGPGGDYLLKDRIHQCLAENEEIYYGNLERNLKKHVPRYLCNLQ